MTAPRDSIALDSSVVIAGLLAWHEAHERALRALVQARSGGSFLVVPAPALVESYSVMTRLPAPHRLSPGDAIDLLSGSFEDVAVIPALDGEKTWSLLHESAHAGLAGGRVYDALILRCARIAGATSLLTLDRGDFLRIDPGEMRIVVPS